MNNIDNYNYQKIYKYGKNGCWILQNPKYALEYALNMSKQLCENFGNTDIIRDVKLEIISVLSAFTLEKTGRKPIILPVIMDIKK